MNEANPTEVEAGITTKGMREQETSDVGHSHLAHVIAGVEAALRHRRIRNLQGDAVDTGRRRLPPVFPQRPDRVPRGRATDCERVPLAAAAEADRQTLDRRRAAPDDADDAVVNPVCGAALLDAYRHGCRLDMRRRVLTGERVPP